MSKSASSEIKTGKVKVKQKNGDVYILERRTQYSAEKGYTVVLGTKLVGKIPYGKTEVEPTRPRSCKKSQETIVASKRRVGITTILNWIGKETGIDADLLASTDKGTALKILTLAQYFLASDGATLPHLEKWQILHTTPYSDRISEETCSRLYETIGQDADLQQTYFRYRAGKTGDSPTIAYDSTTVSTTGRLIPDACQGFNKAHDGNNTVKILTLCDEKTSQPIAFTTQPGNRTDVDSVKNALKQMDFLGLKKPMVVADSGYSSQENMTTFSKESIKFLIMADLNLKWIHRELEAHRSELTKMDSLCPWDHAIHGITVPVEYKIEWQRQRSRKGIPAGKEESEKKRYYLHFFHNFSNTCRDKRNFEDLLFRLRDKIISNEVLSLTEQRKADKYLIVKSKGKDAQITVSYNDETISQANEDAGYFVLVTNKKMETFEALQTYRQREKIEELFKIQKDQLDGTRTRVWSSDRLKGRFFVQFVALGYSCFFRHKIKELKSTLGVETGNPEHDTKGNLQKERKLKSWLEQHSMAQIFDWFDCTEETTVKTPAGFIRWSTENTERDRLFLRKLGIC